MRKDQESCLYKPIFKKPCLKKEPSKYLHQRKKKVVKKHFYFKTIHKTL